MPRRLLTLAAGANVALHLAGLVVALVGMRPGSPVMPLDERLSHLGGQPLGWSLGWGVWMSCALAFVFFIAALSSHAEHRAPAIASVALAAAGAGIDLLCDVGQIAVLPRLAAAPAAVDQFLVWERFLGAGGTVVANGLYSVAVGVASAAVGRALPRHVVVLAALTVAAGLVMVAGGLRDDIRIVEASVGPTMLAFVAWTVAITRAVRRREAAA